MRTPTLAFLVFSLMFMLGCSGDAALPVATSSWDGQVGNSDVTFHIQQSAATLQADGGVLLDFSGTSSIGDVVYSIDIAGGTAITFDSPEDGSEPTATLAVGSSSVNINSTLDGVHYRGTSGEIVFTSYSTDIGSSIKGTFDVGLITTASDPSVGATVSGDFDLELSE